jgi:hypothetical protein
MPSKSPQHIELAAAVARLLRRGLPVAPASVHPVLLSLRGVSARAVDASDSGSRTAALDGLLRGLLARFPDARYAPAARALFGLPPAEAGQNLTARRSLAAAQAGHEVHHFRKRIEPKLIDQLAWELLADADRFTRSPAIAPRLAAFTSRQPVAADPFAWEVTEQEEQLCRTWAAIYALRTELLGLERQISLRSDRTDLGYKAVTAAWRWALARTEALTYAAATGADDPEAITNDLVALAGWTPPLTSAQAVRLTHAAVCGASRAQFVAALHDETELGAAWVGGLLALLDREGDVDELEGPLS